jgi:hypothetical protein
MHHPNLRLFIEQFEREAANKGLYRNKLGEAELLFLQEVWGPAFQYNYEGLRAEYPLKDFKGGQRFADFVYIHNGIKLLLEIDGFTTHARNISPGDFDDHLTRQNDLILSGWLVLRFTAHQVEKNASVCQRQIKQAIGHWWSLTHATLSTKDSDIWTFRRQYVVHLAFRNKGLVTPSQVSTAFDISKVSSIHWLKRFSEEGLFTPVGPTTRVRTYMLVQYKSGEL